MLCLGKAREMESWSLFLPKGTEDAEGDQEHHQGGAVAHGVHDLQLQQVLILQGERPMSAHLPTGCICPFFYLLQEA